MNVKVGFAGRGGIRLTWPRVSEPVDVTDSMRDALYRVMFRTPGIYLVVLHWAPPWVLTEALDTARVYPEHQIVAIHAKPTPKEVADASR